MLPTTDARHRWPVVPNLARDMQLSALDQLWVADITYIRLQEEFAYLAIVLDAFSRRVVGWAMADHLGASLAVTALAMALAARRPGAAWSTIPTAACSTPVPSTPASWRPTGSPPA